MPWQNKFINFNKYSRPMTRLLGVRKIIVHYTANNGAGAESHYRYFNNLSGRYASAHFMVDRLKSLLIIPLNEVAYHANDGYYKKVPELRPNANFYSIGVEMCMETNGTIHADTISRTEDVVAELCRRYNLNPKYDVLRHYDVTSKNCPAPWVSNSRLFVNFKDNVAKKMTSGATTTENTTPLLAEGDSGEYVKEMQEHLIKHGFELVADGHFGAITDKQIREFQEKKKLGVDGYVGANTWKELRAKPVGLIQVSNPIAKPEQALDRNAKTHTIVSGDTFYSIANYYGIGMKKLQSYNPKVKADALSIGDVLQLKDTEPAKPKLKKIGSVLITTKVLNIRKYSSLKSQIIGKAIQNSRFDVYEEKDGLLKIDENKWISGSSKYVSYSPDNKPKPKPALTKSALLTYSGYLRKGDKGSHVKALQNALNALNFKVGTADGIYGADTADGVKRFQSVYLPSEVDGIAGQNTKNKINQKLK